MALTNRPERFLKVNDLENWNPIVDYHLMRTALRLGMVDLHGFETGKNKKRRWVGEIEENHIRTVVFDAISLLIELSSQPMSSVDVQMWMARKYCPEMSKPNCKKCLFEKVCKKRIELFQPIFRTIAY